MGAVLVFNTDGPIERRGEALDTGLARLCGALTADHPESVCRAVMHAMVGSYKPEDDVAMLALRRPTRPFT